MFATVNDLEARYKVLNAEERERAEVLLQDASNIIAAQMGDKVNPEDEQQKELLKAITVAMVKRSISTNDGFGGVPVSNMQQVAGSYSQTLTYANPAGDLYLTRAEKRALGIGKARLAFIPPNIRGGSKCL